MSTILIWRLGALGDTLLLLPALAALRAAYPAHAIVAPGRPAAFAPALWSGLVDRVFDAGGAGLAPLSLGQPPASGLLPTDLDLAVVWSAAHAEIARGLRRHGARRVIAAPILPAAPMPMAAYYLSSLAGAGVTPVPFTLRPPDASRVATDAAWQGATDGCRGPIAVLHAGAGSPLKCWPLRGYLSLAVALRSDGIGVVWTAGPADDGVRAALDAAGEGRHLLPALDVGGLAAVLSRAAVVVAGDSGVAHLAALLDVPAVTLFGPTDHVVWGPPSGQTSVLRLALPCSPCGDIARTCPSRICLRGLPAAAVRAAVHARLGLSAIHGPTTAIPTSASTARRPGSSRPVVWCPPAPAPAPPGALPVQRWDRARTWGAGRPAGPG